MEKKEKLEQIYRLAQELGVSSEEVSEYFSKAPKIKGSADIRSGMYIYADGSISDKIVEGQQIKAVVGYVEKGKVFGVCLHEKWLSWSNVFVLETREMTDGKKATRKILEEAQRQGKTAEAAQWCYEYDRDGVKKGEAFLPSTVELQKSISNLHAVNEALELLGVVPMSEYYSSSNEACLGSSGCHQIVTLPYAHRFVREKNKSGNVRPFISFPI